MDGTNPAPVPSMRWPSLGHRVIAGAVVRVVELVGPEGVLLGGQLTHQREAARDQAGRDLRALDRHHVRPRPERAHRLQLLLGEASEETKCAV
jgi:hypothetical protein